MGTGGKGERTVTQNNCTTADQAVPRSPASSGEAESRVQIRDFHLKQTGFRGQLPLPTVGHKQAEGNRTSANPGLSGLLSMRQVKRKKSKGSIALRRPPRPERAPRAGKNSSASEGRRPEPRGPRRPRRKHCALGGSARV